MFNRRIVGVGRRLEAEWCRDESRGTPTGQRVYRFIRPASESALLRLGEEDRDVDSLAMIAMVESCANENGGVEGRSRAVYAQRNPLPAHKSECVNKSES
jgi:hypothetical protein